MAAVSKFPLLGLTDKEILRTIRVMDLHQILKFSTISERCKNLVKFIKIKGTSIDVYIGNHISVFITTVSGRMNLCYYTEQDMYWQVGPYGRKKRLTPPQSVSRGVETVEDFGRQLSKWTKEDFTMRNWLEHLQNVFNHHKVDSIWFRGNSSEFDIDDIKGVFGNITNVDIGRTGCFVFNQLTLQKFFPIQELTIRTQNFGDSKIPSSLLMQSLVKLEVHENGLNVPTNITLEDLLLINSKVITVENLPMPLKPLNKFIKLWQKGSNPQMEYLSIDYFDGEENDKEIVMKGIKHQVIPADNQRNFKSVGFKDLRSVNGGMDVYRMDGVKATITHLKLNTFTVWRILPYVFIMAVVSKFPLYRLPQNEILRTIRVIDLEDILKFSTISEKCKNLVKFIKIKGTSIDVYIGNHISVFIETVSGRLDLRYYTEPDMYWGVGAYGRKKRLTPPQSVFIGVQTVEGFRTQPFEWMKEDFTIQEWLKHLQDIFIYHKTDVIRFHENSSQFDIDDIKEVFGNTTKVIIEDTGCFAFNQMILQKFFPIEDLSIMTENFRDSKMPPSLLMQNCVRLNIHDNGEGDPTNIILDYLLLMNSKVISVENPQMPQKLLNNFIKLWQKGSNPHMEYLYFDYSDGEENDKEVVLKGIKYQANPINRVRKFKSVGLKTLEYVGGGVDVYRMDGVKATITHLRDDELSFWQMYVWFDHCVVE